MLSEVRFQDDAVRLLRRIADGHLTSPVLLVGEEGTGRRFACLQTAKELLCENKRINCPCGTCVQINSGVHADVITVQADPDKREIGIDQIRDVIEQTLTFPSIDALKLFIIDGADRMTMQAANALLKTLEEPPAYVRFFLLSESYSRTIPTIRSRCGRISFQRLPEEYILDSIGRDHAKALVYARMGEGSLGRARRLKDSSRISTRDKVVSLIQAGSKRDIAAIFSVSDSLDKELPIALKFLFQLTHDLLIAKQDPSRMINVDIAEQIKEIRSSINDATCRNLGASLNRLASRPPSINTLFHFKTTLIEAFVGV